MRHINGVHHVLDCFTILYILGAPASGHGSRAQALAEDLERQIREIENALYVSGRLGRSATRARPRRES